MKKLFAVVAVVAAMVLCSVKAEAAEGEKLLSHDVFFALKDNSPEAQQKLIAACKKYLAKHPGVLHFAVGPIAAELKRDVNDRDFEVALHVLFKNKAFQDQYQKAAPHLKFIEENKDNWKKVRVFDSYVDEN